MFSDVDILHAFSVLAYRSLRHFLCRGFLWVSMVGFSDFILFGLTVLFCRFLLGEVSVL
jgi:hypothetical protein